MTFLGLAGLIGAGMGPWPASTLVDELAPVAWAGSSGSCGLPSASITAKALSINLILVLNQSKVWLSSTCCRLWGVTPSIPWEVLLRSWMVRALALMLALSWSLSRLASRL